MILEVERHKAILDLLQEQGSVTVRHISELLNISRVTTRKDFNALAERGLLVRTRGGACVKGFGTSFEPLYYEKKNLNKEAKALIAKAALECVGNDETIMLDSGSTSFELAKLLKERTGLTVITHDLMLATELGTNSDITVIVAGGILRNNLYSTHGPITAQTLQGLHANKAFLTVDAVDIERGITNATLDGVVLKQALIKNSSEVILIADHSKFGIRSLAHVAELSAIDHIITDDKVPAEIISGIKEAGVKLTIAGEKSKAKESIV